MKVLMQSRTTLFSVPGGDTVQIAKTAEYLRSIGVDVDISIDLEPDLDRYDLVHLFNLIRPQEVYLQARNAQKQGKPVVLSTIYVDYSEYERKVRRGVAGWLAKHISPSTLELIKVLARAVLNFEINKGVFYTLIYGYKSLCEKIVAMTDVFLPNSESEMSRVIADYIDAANKPYVVVPNAVDVGLFDCEKVTPNEGVSRLEGCALSVARIEGLKCQLSLVKAMEGLPFQLLLIGKSAPNHMGYFDEVIRAAGHNVQILGQVQHNDLPQYYKVAKVHALVSWMETTGLSSLEAGIMGCNLVITDKGDTRDYFGDYAFFCDPDDILSIRDALNRAYSAPYPNKSLQAHIRRNFTWDRTAEKTLEGYRIAIGQKQGNMN